jgi:hypothetical protein
MATITLRFYALRSFPQASAHQDMASIIYTTSSHRSPNTKYLLAPLVSHRHTNTHTITLLDTLRQTRTYVLAQTHTHTYTQTHAHTHAHTHTLENMRDDVDGLFDGF